MIGVIVEDLCSGVTGRPLAIPAYADISAQLRSALASFAFSTKLARVNGERNPPRITFGNFSLTDSAVAERGGPNISPWSGRTGHNLGIEDWLLLADFVNTFFDARRLDAKVTVEIASATRILIRNPDTGRVNSLRERLTALNIHRRAGRGKMTVQFEGAWTPENYTKCLRWWAHKESAIRAMLARH